MTKHIYKCPSCQQYTLENNCPSCNSATVRPQPPKFSVEDKYARYRREVKKKELQKRNLY
ncbi:MAG TPA: RNA-protein complex protein Nop10 [Candidatus Nanoarchaeia archaeon]|nr:RNA-protein complex protein Nop10 [Candidatus Nanoarchaeia archaeon]